MRLLIQYIFSLIFILQMYIMMVVITCVFIPLVIINNSLALKAINTWCNWVKFSAKLLVGIKTEIRGTIPKSNVLVIAKHQSFLDIILIVSALKRPKFIMKKEILITPIIGFWAKKIGCIPIDRGKKELLLKKWLKQFMKAIKPNQGNS